MGVVKYTGPVASFHCPTNAEIRSLKVHFSPKQEGSGDPSPENIRNIVGWEGVEATKCGKNLFNPATVTMNFEIGSDGKPLATGNTNRWCITDFIPVKPNTTYIAKSLLTQGSGRSAVYNVNKEKVSAKMETVGVNAETIITTGSTGCYVRLTIRIADGLDTIFKEGTITTSYEPYQGSTTNYEFGTLGKNKFNAYDWQIDGNCINIENANSLTVSTIAYIENYNFYDISSTKGAQRILSFKTKTNSLSNDKASVSLSARKNNGETPVSSVNLKLNEQDYEEEYSLSIAPECDTIQFRNWGYNGSLTLSDIQLELGSTATTYEPYDPKHTVYGGWVDLISGEVCEEYKVTNAEDLQVSYYTRAYEQMDYFDFRFKNRQVMLDTLCNTAKYYSTRQDATGSGVPSYWIGYLNSGGVSRPYIGFSFPSTFFSTHPTADNVEDSYQEILNKCSILFTEQLSTPNTYHLAPTQLQTFLGQNNIWSNADYVEVEYDLHETQDILARKQFIMANQPHIETLAPAPLQSFNTDMVAPLKECKVYFEPVQDLRGQDAPYPPGGGKNLLRVTADDGNPHSGMMFTTNADGTIKVVGTSSGNFSIFGTATLPAGTYTFSHGSNLSGFYLNIPGVKNSSTTGSNFTLSEDTTVEVKLFPPASGTEVNGYLEPMIRLSTSPAGYAPYSNECPITGWTGANIQAAGKNLWDEEWEAGSINASGQLQTSTTRIRSKNYISVKPETEYRYYNGASVPADFSYYKNDGTFISSERITTGTVGTSRVFTTPVLCAKIKFAPTSGYGTTYNNNIGINYPSSDTSYHTYQGITIPITFPVVNNLLEKVSITTGQTINSNDGTLFNETGMATTNFIKVNEGETYTLSFISAEGARTRRIFGYDANKDSVESLAHTSWASVGASSQITATIPSGISYIRVCYLNADTDKILEGPESHTIYGGYIDLINGEIVQEWDSKIINGTENWGTQAPHDTFARIFLCNPTNSTMLGYSNATAPNGYTDWLDTCKGSGDEYIGGRLCCRFGWGDRNFYLLNVLENIPSITDVNSLKSYLSEHNIHIVYKLQNPIHYSLTPQTLKTLRGTNNIWSNANGNISIKYWTH